MRTQLQEKKRKEYEKDYQGWSSKQKKKWEQYLAGLWEGKGSMTVSFKKNKNCKIEFYIDPKISLTQHEEGIHLLIWAKCYFRTGKLFLKPGYDNVWVYSVTNRRSILENFIPFFEKHMLPWTSKRKAFETFKEINLELDKKSHHSLEGFKKLTELGHQINSLEKKK